MMYMREFVWCRGGGGEFGDKRRGNREASGDLNFINLLK